MTTIQSDNYESEFNEVIELTELVISNSITLEGMARLEMLLKSNLACRQVYLSYIGMHMELEHCLDRSSFEDRIWNDLFKHKMSESTNKRLGSSMKFFVLACSVILLITAYTYMVFNLPVEECSLICAQTDDVKFNTNKMMPGEIVRKHQHIDLVAGIISLKMDSGAIVDVKGPSEIVISGDNEIHLIKGELRGIVGQQAIGFTVKTEHAKVVDLGTEFLVQNDPDQGTKVSVRQGMVELIQHDGSGNNKKTAKLTVNQTAIVNKSLFEFLGHSNLAYKHFDQSRSGIVGVEGNCRLDSARTLMLISEARSTVDHILILPEMQRILIEEEKTLNSVSGEITLHRGDVVSSYLMHYDPGKFNTKPPIGSVCFNSEILAVVADVQELKKLDPLFAVPRSVFEDTEARGSEITENDRFVISDDKKQLNIHLNHSGSHYMDQCRILVLDHH